MLAFELDDRVERAARRFALDPLHRASPTAPSAMVRAKTLEMLWIEKASSASPVWQVPSAMMTAMPKRSGETVASAGIRSATVPRSAQGAFRRRCRARYSQDQRRLIAPGIALFASPALRPDAGPVGLFTKPEEGQGRRKDKAGQGEGKVRSACGAGRGWSTRWASSASLMRKST
jgi:hypothetical protein